MLRLLGFHRSYHLIKKRHKARMYGRHFKIEPVVFFSDIYLLNVHIPFLSLPSWNESYAFPFGQLFRIYRYLNQNRPNEGCRGIALTHWPSLMIHFQNAFTWKSRVFRRFRSRRYEKCPWIPNNALAAALLVLIKNKNTHTSRVDSNIKRTCLSCLEISET